jgi:hypothetical protein
MPAHPAVKGGFSGRRPGCQIPLYMETWQRGNLANPATTRATNTHTMPEGSHTANWALFLAACARIDGSVGATMAWRGNAKAMSSPRGQTRHWFMATNPGHSWPQCRPVGCTWSSRMARMTTMPAGTPPLPPGPDGHRPGYALAVWGSRHTPRHDRRRTPHTTVILGMVATTSVRSALVADLRLPMEVGHRPPLRGRPYGTPRPPQATITQTGVGARLPMGTTLPSSPRCGPGTQNHSVGQDC